MNNLVTTEKYSPKDEKTTLDVIEKILSKEKFYDQADYKIFQNPKTKLFGVSDLEGEIVTKPFYSKIIHLSQSFFLLELKRDGKVFYGIRDADDISNFPVVVNFQVIVWITGNKIAFSNPDSPEKIIFNLKKGTTEFLLK